MGSGIRESLFEPLDYATGGLIRGQVIDCINRYEPRISLDNVIVEPDDLNNGYNVEIFFTIVGRDDTPEAVEFFLERTR